MAHFALPHLKKAKGCILNIASKTALTGQGGNFWLCIGKGCDFGTDARVGRGTRGIRNPRECDCSGRSDDAVIPEWLGTFPNPEEKLQSILAKIPLDKRMTAPEEIAAMVVFLLSARRARYRATYFRGWRIRASGPIVDLKLTWQIRLPSPRNGMLRR